MDSAAGYPTAEGGGACSAVFEMTELDKKRGIGAMKHFLVRMAVLALIAMPASAADGSGQTPTLEAISGGSEPAQNAPELLLPEPGSFTGGGALCDSCPAEAGCEIFDGTPVAGDTTNNTASGGGEAGDCADTSAVVAGYYEYVAACTGIVSVSATTAGGNPVIVIHGFIPPAGCNALVACDDTGAGLSFNVMPGEI